MEFSPDNYDLSKLPKVAVEYLIKKVADACAAKKKEIEGKKPQQDRYFKTTNYRDDLDAWRANVAEVDSFFDAISAALNKRLAELAKADKKTDDPKDAAEKFAARDDHDFTVFHQTLADAASTAKGKKFKIKVWIDADGKISIGDSGTGALLGKCEIDKSNYYPGLGNENSRLARQVLHFVDRKTAELRGVELAPPTSAQGALAAYEREQRIVLGKDKADEDAQFHEVVANDAMEGQDVWAKFDWDGNEIFKTGTAEEQKRARAYFRIDELANKPPLMKTIETTEFFEALFPDRGGTPFFSDSYIKEQEKYFKKKIGKSTGFNIVSVLKRYNILARCFNTQGKSSTPPPIKFELMDKRHAGGYRLSTKSITLNTLRQNYSVTTTAHELGHWYEHEIAGDEQVQEDWKWLKNYGGITDDNLKEKLDQATNQRGETFIRALRRPYAPRFASIDGYSSRVYLKQDDNTAVSGTDLTATSLEYFLTNPLEVLRSAPEQIERLFESLASLEKKAP